LIGCLLVLGAAAFGQEDAGSAWEGTVPEQIRRPQRGGESPYYPRDVVIGELGRGGASVEAYRFAGEVLSAFLHVSGSGDDAALAGIGPLLLEETRKSLKAISPVKFGIGGGREEDGGVSSFLFASWTGNRE
jgi:hypothetical protein